MRYAITGANRGIGLEFVRQLLDRGDTIEAGARMPSEARLLMPLAREAAGRLRIHQLDVTDLASVRAFATAVNEGPLDVLINNAGITGKWSSLMELDFEDMAHVMNVNAFGPLRLSAALMPALRRGAARKIVHITTRMASLAENAQSGVHGFCGGAYAYRMSKAALNMGMRSMALDFHKEGLITSVIDPGWVQTDMGGKQAPLRVDDAVRGMLQVIDGLTLEHSGRFFDFKGTELLW